MKRAILKLAALAMLLGVTGQVKAAMIIGVFGYAGNTPNYLDVTTTTGSFDLSTDTNEINPGTDNQGWWSQLHPNRDSNADFALGKKTDFGVINDFFTFDITALAGQSVTGLTLNIQNPGTNVGIGTGTTYYVYDVSTDPLTLNAKVNNPNPTIVADLGSGKLYGTQFIPAVNPVQYFIALDSNAVNDLQAAINAGDTYFSTGGTIFPSTTATPEPSTLTLLGISAVCSIGYGWRRRRQTVSLR